jgi:hypothetical protein
MFWLIMRPNIDSILKKDKGEFLGDTKKTQPWVASFNSTVNGSVFR